MMNPKVQKAIPIVCAVLGAVGVVATSVLVATRAEKANIEIRKAKETKDTKQVAKAFIKGYYPAIISGVATIATITTGTIVSKKIEASLSTTILMLDATLHKYKHKLFELFGDKAKLITESISEDEYKKEKKELPKVDNSEYRLYWEEHIGFFKAKPEKLEEALAETNERLMSHKGWSSFNVLLKSAEAEIVKIIDVDKVSYDYGWTIDYINEVYPSQDTENNALHMECKPHADADGVIDYYILMFDKDPIFGVTAEYLGRLGGYDISELEDSDASALLYDELKDMKPIKKGDK